MCTFETEVKQFYCQKLFEAFNWREFFLKLRKLKEMRKTMIISLEEAPPSRDYKKEKENKKKHEQRL